MKTLNNNAANDRLEIWVFGSLYTIVALPILLSILILIRNFVTFYNELKANEQTIIDWFVVACVLGSAAFVMYLISNRNK